VRRVSPKSVIVIGGHVAATPAFATMVDADHFVCGDGISWMRRFLGEDDTAPSATRKSFPASEGAPWG